MATDDEETVFIPKNRYGSANGVYHTDAECLHLDNAKNVREVSKDVLFDDVTECSRCADEASSSGVGNGHLESLKAAAREESVRELSAHVDVDGAGGQP